MNSHRDPRLPEPGEPPDVLVTLLHQELRRLAAGCLRRERPNHTLQPTALVNEAWLRLAAQSQPGWNGRVQFLAVASHLMREVLIDYARTRNRAKRGGGQAPICVEDAGELAAAQEVDMVALDDALNLLEHVEIPAEPEVNVATGKDEVDSLIGGGWPACLVLPEQRPRVSRIAQIWPSPTVWKAGQLDFPHSAGVFRPRLRVGIEIARQDNGHSRRGQRGQQFIHLCHLNLVALGNAGALQMRVHETKLRFEDFYVQ